MHHKTHFKTEVKATWEWHIQVVPRVRTNNLYVGKMPHGENTIYTTGFGKCYLMKMIIRLILTEMQCKGGLYWDIRAA